MATAPPAALGLKLSHFAGSSTARTGGSKIGTARKIHLAEASMQQSGRGAARRGGGRRGGRGRGCGEETLHSLPQARPSPGADPLCPPPPTPDGYMSPRSHLCTPRPRHSRVLKDPEGSWADQVSSSKAHIGRLPSPFAPLPTPPSQLWDRCLPVGLSGTGDS